MKRKMGERKNFARISQKKPINNGVSSRCVCGAVCLGDSNDITALDFKPF